MVEQAARTAPPIRHPDLDLPIEDGIPMDSPWHRSQINLLIELTHQHWKDRTDYYTGGNMFIYYSLEQAEAVIKEVRADIPKGIPPPEARAYRGPDYFVVTGVDGTRPRDKWVVWEEGGRYPDLIIELLSPSTATIDKTTKKRLYEQTFRTPEYFWYDPESGELVGWHLADGEYVPRPANEQGRLWSGVLNLWIGTWQGTFQAQDREWVRFYTEDGTLVPTEAEAARKHAEAAEQELAEARRRAEAAEAELARVLESKPSDE